MDFMDLSLGDRVFYTRSNGMRVPATVVGMAGDGFIHLEYYQDALRVVNRCVLCEGKVVCNFLELGQFGSPNSKGVSKGCAWGLFGGNIV